MFKTIETAGTFLGFDKRVPQQFRLALEGLARITRVFHQRNLLSQQARDVHGVSVRFFALSFVERMVAVDVDYRALTERLRTRLTKMIKAAGDPRLTHF